MLASENLDGGVWRLKVLTQHDESSYDILASCMHAGTRIVRVFVPANGDGGGKIEVLAKFEEHESMNYGSDFQPLKLGEKGMRSQFTVVSTSFYDKRACLWKYQAATGDSMEK
jgi:diphthamide biosynthesis protein 7